MPRYKFGPELIQDWDLTFEDFEEEQGEMKKSSSSSKQQPETELENAEGG